MNASNFIARLFIMKINSDVNKRKFVQVFQYEKSLFQTESKRRKTIIYECQRIKIELPKVLHILHSTCSCGLDHICFTTIIAKNNLHSL